MTSPCFNLSATNIMNCVCVKTSSENPCQMPLCLFLEHIVLVIKNTMNYLNKIRTVILIGGRKNGDISEFTLNPYI